jgi:hypothetical protein
MLEEWDFKGLTLEDGMGVVQVTQQQQLHIDHGVEAVPLIFELEELLLLTES